MREVRLAEILTQVQELVPVDTRATYDTVGLLSYGKGAFPRPPVAGGKTTYKTFFRVRTGQLVYSRLFGWEGALTVIDDALDGRLVSPEFPVFDVSQERVTPEFLRLLTRWPQLWERMARTVTGMGGRRKRVYPSQFLSVTVPLPPLREQQRIVSLLSAVDEVSERAKGAQAVSEQVERTLGLALLEEAGREAPDARLGDVAELTLGATPPRSEATYWTADLERPFCTIADMDGRWVNPIREGVTAAAERERKARRVPAGSLLMSFKLTIGKVGFARRDLFPNEAIVWIEPRDAKVTKQYLAVWLANADLVSNANRAVKGKTLNKSSLAAIPVRVPEVEKQNWVVAQTSAASVVTESFGNERRQAEALHAALLQDAINGWIALGDSPAGVHSR